MKIFLSVGADDKVKGWGSTRGSANDIEMEVNDDHDVLVNPFIYKYTSGKFVKDLAYQQELIKQKKNRSISPEQRLGEELIALRLEIAKLKGGRS